MKKRKKGTAASLTVEAALALPVFLFGILFFLYFFQILFLQDSIQRGITETGRFISRYQKVWEGEEIQGFMEKLALKRCFLTYLDEENINASCIIGGVYGISLSTSRIMETESEIDVAAVYRLRILVPFFGEKTALVKQRVRTRAFVGKKMRNQAGDNSFGENQSEEDFIVYVTENGSVYHLSGGCTHLKLSITGVGQDALNSARNENGGKYKPCEKCIGNKVKEGGFQEKEFYIAREGDRYHLSLACSGLKRTVYTVYYSTVKGKRRCTRCG